MAKCKGTGKKVHLSQKDRRQGVVQCPKCPRLFAFRKKEEGGTVGSVLEIPKHSWESV